MFRNILLPNKTHYCLHNDTISIWTMRSNLKTFFTPPRGKREHIQAYRGCLIVRNTRKYRETTNKRYTQVYVYFPNYSYNYPGTFCLFSGECSIKQAKKKIDECLLSCKIEPELINIIW